MLFVWIVIALLVAFFFLKSKQSASSFPVAAAPAAAVDTDINAAPVSPNSKSPDSSRRRAARKED
jgi:hypothetical protein